MTAMVGRCVPMDSKLPRRCLFHFVWEKTNHRSLRIGVNRSAWSR
jgi:hypothetical protein